MVAAEPKPCCNAYGANLPAPVEPPSQFFAEMRPCQACWRANQDCIIPALQYGSSPGHFERQACQHCEALGVVCSEATDATFDFVCRGPTSSKFYLVPAPRAGMAVTQAEGSAAAQKRAEVKIASNPTPKASKSKASKSKGSKTKTPTKTLEQSDVPQDKGKAPIRPTPAPKTQPKPPAERTAGDERKALSDVDNEFLYTLQELAAPHVREEEVQSSKGLPFQI